MAVLSLHELAQRQLRALLETRFMKGGWDREGDRKVATRFLAAHKVLENKLLTTSERLMVNPEHEALRGLMQIAAQERTIEGMVIKFVDLLSALDVPDQADAYAAAELRARLAYLERVRAQLQDTRKKLKETVDGSGVRGVDFPELFQQLDDSFEKTNKEYQAVEARLAAYEAILHPA